MVRRSRCSHLTIHASFENAHAARAKARVAASEIQRLFEWYSMRFFTQYTTEMMRPYTPPPTLAYAAVIDDDDDDVTRGRAMEHTQLYRIINAT